MSQKQTKKKIWATTLRLDYDKHKECIKAFEELKQVSQEIGIPFYQAMCRAAMAYTAVLKMSLKNNQKGLDKDNQ